ncbi:unnamed protein product [Microthlaspi erraticum]|uniref:Uncharacterized protein n=1 Tax=Microthlaspi erraticum TaxID=1685480 RepID=A0A6D2K9M0_9BRAS|nr:unnamed protein product [Microthlaspi erraticum]CAA7049723.1 unnamed protein product [Microthlaspi erraticum]
MRYGPSQLKPNLPRWSILSSSDLRKMRSSSAKRRCCFRKATAKSSKLSMESTRRLSNHVRASPRRCSARALQRCALSSSGDAYLCHLMAIMKDEIHCLGSSRPS